MDLAWKMLAPALFRSIKRVAWSLGTSFRHAPHEGTTTTRMEQYHFPVSLRGYYH